MWLGRLQAHSDRAPMWVMPAILRVLRGSSKRAMDSARVRACWRRGAAPSEGEEQFGARAFEKLSPLGAFPGSGHRGGARQLSDEERLGEQLWDKMQEAPQETAKRQAALRCTHIRDAHGHTA
jgi:hypothetical protein